jgi:hypothetical protein
MAVTFAAILAGVIVCISFLKSARITNLLPLIFVVETVIICFMDL